MASATYLGEDTTTKGSWDGTYGSHGYWLAASSASLPPGVTLTSDATTYSTYEWSSATDPRILTGPGGVARDYSEWDDPVAFDMELDTGGTTLDVSLYACDQNTVNRRMTIEVFDATSSASLSGPISSGQYDGGIYWRWRIQGAVTLRVTRTEYVNCLLNGIFLDSIIPDGPEGRLCGLGRGNGLQS